MDVLFVFALIILVVLVLAFFADGNSGPASNTQPRKYKPRKKYEPRKSAPKAVPQEKPLNLPPIPASLKLRGKAYVIDGDTIRIGKTKIRLAGVDAPETHMPYGQKAKWAMVEICKGQVISAELTGERSFDRLVGTCYLPDGRDIGAEIIKKGLALDLACFSGGKYRCYEPEGARRMLCYGKFGHSSIKKKTAPAQNRSG